MGQYAEDILDGICNSEGDYSYQYDVHYRKRKYQKDTPAEANIRAVRKELAILIKKKHEGITDEKVKNRLVGEARSEINLKYGKGWRERGLVSNSDNQWQPLENYPLNK